MGKSCEEEGWGALWVGSAPREKLETRRDHGAGEGRFLSPPTSQPGPGTGRWAATGRVGKGLRETGQDWTSLPVAT